jgi:hypothetical protein
MFVDRVVEDFRVLLEYVLRSVAMVNVEIDDSYSPGVPPDLQIPGRDCDIIEIAKAERLIRFGVVAGRTHRAEGVIDLTVHQHIDRVEDAADSEQGRLVGLGAYLVVGAVQFAKIENTGFLQPVYVFGRMNLLDPFHFGGSGWNGYEFRE